MKKIIKIRTTNKNYSVIVEKNSTIKHIINETKLVNKTVIIIDSKIFNLFKKLKSINNIHLIKISAGEKIKSLESYSKICSDVLKLKIDRSSLIIAIGGGTIGDLSGLVASTILRGVKFILIPTTLLSQVDSSVGGKNGINTIYGKNLIGTFYQPDKVIIDIAFLDTLPKRELRSGYAEVLKHALIKNTNFFKWLDKNLKNIMTLKKNYISRAIIESIKIKVYFVQKDEYEKLKNSNSRAMLNFGHTFGHALETMNNYSNNLTHGEAVAIGMSLASKISNKIGSLSKKDYESLILHFKKAKLPIYDKRIKNNKLYNLMLADKKNTNNHINLILLKKIGQAYFYRNMDKGKIKRILN